MGWLGFLLAMAPVAIKMIGGGLFGMEKPAWWGDTFLLSVWGPAVVAGIASAALRNQARPGTVEVSGAGLDVVIDGKSRHIPRDAIAGATVAPNQALVLHMLDGEVMTAVFASTAEADAMLSKLELDVGKRRFEASFSPGPKRPLIGIAVGLALLLWAPASEQLFTRGAAGLVFLLTAVAMVAGWVLGTRPAQVEVGADGVRIQRAFESVFLPFAEIAAVGESGRALVLSRADGGEERVEVPGGNEAFGQALRHRIELGLAAHADAADAGPRLALLKRGHRSLEAWRARLGELVEQDAGYRDLPLSRDDLVAILHAPATSVEDRIGAALALEALEGEVAAAKIRVAAESCAEPRARVALERILDAELDEAALGEALATEELAATEA